MWSTAMWRDWLLIGPKALHTFWEDNGRQGAFDLVSAFLSDGFFLFFFFKVKYVIKLSVEK